MTPSDDYDDEMLRGDQYDDAAIEALFTGHGADGELALLAELAEDLRSVVSGPAPAPSPQLMAMFTKGISTNKGDVLVTAGSVAPGPAPQASGLPRWRRRKMLISEFLLGLSVAAKAGFGVGIAAASVTAAGAAGALPPAAQHAVSTAVSAATPFSFPDKANERADFGKTVSTDARDGGVDGKVVSDAAKGQGNGLGVDNRPADPGQNGLDQANQTPAAGRVPTSVPSGQPATPGSQGSTGLDRANQTPAAGHVPTSVPSGPPTSTGPGSSTPGSPGQNGLDRANQTPAAGHVPGRPAGRP